MDYTSIVKKALGLYSIDVNSFEYIAQSGNTIYKITDCEEKSYCLRLNISKNNALDSRWTSKSAIDSEMQWVYALSQETDIKVPVPYKNIYGAFISNVDGVLCSIVEWLDGEHKPYVTTYDEAGHVGEMIGKLHKQSSHWPIPIGFSRPAYDESSILEMLQKIDGVTGLDFKEESLAILKEAACKVITLFNSTKKTCLSWGMIHGDILPSNFLFYKQEVRPIDFGGCGYGFYLWDIARLLSFVPIAFRENLFNSYAKYFLLPNNYIKLTEGFLVASHIEALNFHLKLTDSNSWLPEYIDQLSNAEFLWYINNVDFLFTANSFFRDKIVTDPHYIS